MLRTAQATKNLALVQIKMLASLLSQFCEAAKTEKAFTEADSIGNKTVLQTWLP